MRRLKSMTEEDRKFQLELWEEFEKTTKTIDSLQAKFDRKEFYTYDGAMTLQKARTKRKAIMKQFKPVYPAWTHPEPGSLPPPEKRTRNEVREIMGLPPIG